jgi:hypothetical protein
MLQCEEIWMQMPIASLTWHLMRRLPGRSHRHECMSRPTVSALDLDPAADARDWDYASLEAEYGLAPRDRVPYTLTLQGRRKVRWDETTAINLCCDGRIVNVHQGRRPLRIVVNALRNGAAVILASFKGSSLTLRTVGVTNPQRAP